VSVPTDVPVVAFASRDEWDAWLAEHHGGANGVWLRIAKNASGIESVTHPEALEIALCYGWIDGQRRKLDDLYFLQRFTPRRRRSRWSKINRAKAEELIATGRMQPAGLREVEAAKADGRWEAAYDSPSAVTVPDDLLHALERNDAARESFETLSGTNRYAILYQIHEAKRPETRARRIEKFVAMLERGETPYP
jgi:uncharacterized protein YdeI (YjbR/CyaY-like superfamily)